MTSLFHNNEEPDHVLEEYWKSFKDFIKHIQRLVPHSVADDIDLDNWVINLNILKTNREYVNIEKYIEQYMIIIGWIIMKYYDHYYFGLYITQLKRWRKIPSICLDEKRQNAYSDEYFKHFNDNSFMLYVRLLTSLSKTHSALDNDIYIKLFSQLHIPDYSDPHDTEIIKYNINIIFSFNFI